MEETEGAGPPFFFASRCGNALNRFAPPHTLNLQSMEAAMTPQWKYPAPDRRINLSEEQAVRYWTKQLGTDEATLKEAVGMVGDSEEAVRDLLNCSDGT
jgi:hypothetical protein